MGLGHLDQAASQGRVRLAMAGTSTLLAAVAGGRWQLDTTGAATLMMQGAAVAGQRWQATAAHGGTAAAGHGHREGDGHHGLLAGAGVAAAVVATDGVGL